MTRKAKFVFGLVAALLAGVGTEGTLLADDSARIRELDAYWQEVSRTVREGDFEGYKATCHEAGVLISGSSKTTERLEKALARWKQGFVDTKAGKMKASVEFRFTSRWGDETTAHESGIFLYSTVDAEGKRKDSYVRFENVLVKENGWKTLTEYQKGPASREDWEKVK
jgi:hypothetical protein